MHCERTTTKTVNLGRLPVYCGYFREDADDDFGGYHKYNIVTYKGSSFINLVEGNKKTPVKIVYEAGKAYQYSDSSVAGSYEFVDDAGTWTGWAFVANALDAKIWAQKAQYLVENNFFALEIQENGDIVATYGLGGQIDKVWIVGESSDDGTEDIGKDGDIVIDLNPLLLNS